MSRNPFADSKLTFGAELARKLSEGVVHRAPTGHIQGVRDSVTEACDELIGIGARIRPLFMDGLQAGWVRGIFETEKRILRRWVPDRNEFVFRCLLLATTLTGGEIDHMTSLEVQKLIRLVVEMEGRDVSLYPYLSAFSTTMESEALWHGGGGIYSSFSNQVILMPDGRKITLLCPSNHARLWASLCTYREQAKNRLDENWNAVLIMRAWAGKAVDGLAAELKVATKQMRPNALEPWENIVSAPPDKSLDDGWAHLENMETREGMLKELHGMLNNDRHERLMAKFEGQQIEAAEQRKRDIEQMVSRRGGSGISREVIRIETEDDVRKREDELRKGRVIPPSVTREGTERPVGGDIRERIKKYQ